MALAVGFAAAVHLGPYDNLPSLPFPSAPDAYPGRDDVADYLLAYAAKFELPVRLNMSVTSLTGADGSYVAKAGEEALEARQVVVATGPLRVPFTPPIAETLDRACTRSTAPATGTRRLSRREES